jgi:tetratricopeptide (TPR) repeat protein
MEKITSYLIKPTVTQKGIVKAWEETVLLPTYETGEEEKNPVFLEKRVYQGSSGAVYPYPVVEKICDGKKDKPYKALFIENEYIKVMILPELGGRVQMAYDKVRARHFVYYNQVIKPALVGLTGPWISGGIEFNWPQHHRPGTYLPVDCLTEEHADGSVTVWCSEVERMSRTKGMHGFTLYPGKAYIEIRVKVYNRTSFPRTFLWWANPAVVVNDRYHSVFPPDVHAVFDHGKRDVSNFPVATGIYYKQDYSAGVDISKYKNIPVPTSYMAVESKYDFVGGYDEDARAGLLHVADHHLSPGKKQWTWGNGDFGQAWDRNLTDEDGPYIELMTGVYTDNQPDFSWLQPGEEKSWVQYFMPYAEAGYVKNATKDAVVNVEVQNGHATIILYTTSEFKDLRIVLADSGGNVYLDDRADVSPDRVYAGSIAVGDVPADELMFTLYAPDGRRMLGYRADKPGIKPVPEPAQAADLPEDIASVEQLYLTGLHLEQYRHATYSPEDYYREALRREPGDVRCNNAMGRLFMHKGLFAEAERHFRRAVKTLTQRNPNPYDGEPFYNLGWSLRMQGKEEEAYGAFYKSVWNAAWQDAGYFALAQMDVVRGEWDSALDKAERSLARNRYNHKARHLKTVILRRLGEGEEALSAAGRSLAADPFNMGCRFEKYLLTENEGDLREFTSLMRGAVHTYLEYALDYAAAGLYDEASQLLSLCIDGDTGVYPMVYYALGYFASCSGRQDDALDYYAKASAMSPDRCFPNRMEEVGILQDAILLNPQDAHAHYYLGNFRYAVRLYDDAVACWEKSVRINGRFPPALRNLALAYYNKYGRRQEARRMLEDAFRMDGANARMLMELDQLYRKTNVPPAVRLEHLERHLPLVEQRDDLCIERITLYNRTGQYGKARQLIDLRQFHPWEGGEGKITGQYVLCRVEPARQAIENNDFERALALLHETDAYPHNLGEGKLANAEENDIDYFKGLACRGLGDEERAVLHFRKATAGASEPEQAIFYNDRQPDKIFYQGLAWEALGETGKARSRFNKLIDHGKKHLFDDCRIDYFAVSLPDLAIWDDDLNLRNRVHCNYVIGLGLLGLGNRAEARQFLSKALELDVNHQGAQIQCMRYGFVTPTVPEDAGAPGPGIEI